MTARPRQEQKEKRISQHKTPSPAADGFLSLRERSKASPAILFLSSPSGEDRGEGRIVEHRAAARCGSLSCRLTKQHLKPAFNMAGVNWSLPSAA